MFNLFNIEDDSVKAVIILVLLVAVVVISSVYMNLSLDRKYIENGYTRTRLVGSSCTHWVKK